MPVVSPRCFRRRGSLPARCTSTPASPMPAGVGRPVGRRGPSLRRCGGAEARAVRAEHVSDAALLPPCCRPPACRPRQLFLLLQSAIRQRAQRPQRRRRRKVRPTKTADGCPSRLGAPTAREGGDGGACLTPPCCRPPAFRPRQLFLPENRALHCVPGGFDTVEDEKVQPTKTPGDRRPSQAPPSAQAARA